MLGGVSTFAMPRGRAIFSRRSLSVTPAQQLRAAHRECRAVHRDERAVGQFVDRHFVRPLRAAVEPFGLKHDDPSRAHSERARLSPAPISPRTLSRPRGGIRSTGGGRPRAPSPRRGRTVRCIAVAPDLAMPALERQHAADPLPRGPAALAQCLVVAMKTPAAIAEKQCRARASRSVRRKDRPGSAAAHQRFSAACARLRRRVEPGSSSALLELVELLAALASVHRASCLADGRSGEVNPLRLRRGRLLGRLVTGGSEAGKLSSSSSSSSFSSLFSILLFGGMRGPSASPPRVCRCARSMVVLLAYARKTPLIRQKFPSLSELTGCRDTTPAGTSAPARRPTAARSPRHAPPTPAPGDPTCTMNWFAGFGSRLYTSLRKLIVPSGLAQPVR